MQPEHLKFAQQQVPGTDLDARFLAADGRAGLTSDVALK